ACGQRFGSGFRAIVRRNRHDWCVPKGSMRAKLPSCSQAIKFWQAQVHENQRWSLLQRELYGLLAIRRFEHIMTSHLEQPPHHEAAVFEILDHQEGVLASHFPTRYFIVCHCDALARISSERGVPFVNMSHENATQKVNSIGSNSYSFGASLQPLYMKRAFPTPSDASGLEDLGRATLRIVHDIKNHLNGLKLYATFLSKRLEELNRSEE